MAFFNRTRAEGGKFVSQERQDIDTVRDRLDAARAELALAETILRDRSLAVALSEDRFAAETELEAVRRGKERVGLLETALTAADAAERTRLAAARSAEEKSRLRAIRSHVSSAKKIALEYEAGVERQLSAWRRLNETADSISALLRPGEIGLHTKFPMPKLFDLCSLQLAKVASAQGASKRAPGTPDHTKVWSMIPHGQGIAAVPDLSEALETRLLASLRQISGGEEITDV